MTLENVSERLLTVHDASNLLDLVVRTVWRLHSAGKLPAGVRVGPRAVRWRQEEVEMFVQELPSARGTRCMGARKGGVDE